MASHNRSMELLLQTASVRHSVCSLAGARARIDAAQPRGLPRIVWTAGDTPEIGRFLLAVGGVDGRVVAFSDRWNCRVSVFGFVVVINR
jgi:hypothetical protein